MTSGPTASDDVTPDGEPIDTHTIWLAFPEGEIAITADLTRLNAAFRRVPRPVDPARAAALDFEQAQERVNEVMDSVGDAIARLRSTHQ